MPTFIASIIDTYPATFFHAIFPAKQNTDLQSHRATFPCPKQPTKSLSHTAAYFETFVATIQQTIKKSNESAILTPEFPTNKSSIFHTNKSTISKTQSFTNKSAFIMSTVVSLLHSYSDTCVDTYISTFIKPIKVANKATKFRAIKGSNFTTVQVASLLPDIPSLSCTYSATLPDTKPRAECTSILRTNQTTEQPSFFTAQQSSNSRPNLATGWKSKCNRSDSPSTSSIQFGINQYDVFGLFGNRTGWSSDECVTTSGFHTWSSGSNHVLHAADYSNRRFAHFGCKQHRLCYRNDISELHYKF